MYRQYKVHAQVSPTIDAPAPEVIRGNFSFGAFDAVKKYCADNLPGYQAIPGGVAYGDGFRRFDAVNHDAGLGASIWVKEGE